MRLVSIGGKHPAHVLQAPWHECSKLSPLRGNKVIESGFYTSQGSMSSVRVLLPTLSGLWPEGWAQISSIVPLALQPPASLPGLYDDRGSTFLVHIRFRCIWAKAIENTGSSLTPKALAQPFSCISKDLWATKLQILPEWDCASSHRGPACAESPLNAHSSAPASPARARNMQPCLMLPWNYMGSGILHLSGFAMPAEHPTDENRMYSKCHSDLGPGNLWKDKASSMDFLLVFLLQQPCFSQRTIFLSTLGRADLSSTSETCATSTALQQDTVRTKVVFLQ